MSRADNWTKNDPGGQNSKCKVPEGGAGDLRGWREGVTGLEEVVSDALGTRPRWFLLTVEQVWGHSQDLYTPSLQRKRPQWPLKPDPSVFPGVI